MYYKWEGGRIPWAVRSAVGDALEKLCKRIVRELKAILNVRFPPASKPGQPPRKRTGNLRNNVTYNVNRKTLEAAVYIQDEAFYWFYLEFGTSKMAARPFIRIVMRRNAKLIKTAIPDAAAKAIRKELRNKKKGR